TALGARDGRLRASPARGRQRGTGDAALHAARPAPAARRLGGSAASPQHDRASRPAGGVRRARASRESPAGRTRVSRDPGGTTAGHPDAGTAGGARGDPARPPRPTRRSPRRPPRPAPPATPPAPGPRPPP